MRISNKSLPNHLRLKSDHGCNGTSQIDRECRISVTFLVRVTVISPCHAQKTEKTYLEYQENLEYLENLKDQENLSMNPRIHRIPTRPRIPRQVFQVFQLFQAGIPGFLGNLGFLGRARYDEHGCLVHSINGSINFIDCPLSVEQLYMGCEG